VLLAVVLIVALVSVALLGFFPGMASDAQRQQTEMYWRSATPIAIVEWDVVLRASDGVVMPYFRLRNNGMYPIRLTGVIGGDDVAATLFYVNGGAASCVPQGAGATFNISDYYYFAPGEEKYFGGAVYQTTCDARVFSITSSTSSVNVGGAKSLCQNSTSSPGTLIYDHIGFSYIEYIDGQQISKKQAGKSVIIKCRVV